MIETLHVDDSADERELFKFGIEQRDSGIHITGCAGVDEALELLNGQPFDCIICDYQMPKKNGMDLLLTMRERRHEIPFIFLTGQGNERLATDAFRNGADDYFTKDIGFAHYDRIVNSIHRLVAGNFLRLSRERAEVRYRALFENILEGVSVFEAVENGADFVFRAINKAVENIDHLQRENVVGRCLSEVFPEAERLGFTSVFRRVWLTGTAEFFPIKFYADDRISGWRENYVYRLPSGEIVAVYRDLTAQKKAEEALADSEAKFRSLFDKASDPIYLWETDGNGMVTRLLEVNDAATAILGYSREKLLTFLPGDLQPPDLRSQVAQFIDTIFGRRQYTFTTTHRRVDGVEVPVEINAHLIEMSGNKLILSVVRDLSGRPRGSSELQLQASEAARRALQMQTELLEATNRELEAFAYTVSHDLRAPLRRMHQYVDLLMAEHGARLDPEVNTGLSRLQGNLAELSVQVNHLLEFSRLTNWDLHRCDVDLSSLALEILRNLREEEPQRQVDLHVQEGLKVSGDPQLLRLLLENLLGNAWKYTGRREIAEIRLFAADNGGVRQFHVRDNGVGFDSLMSKKLFVPFSRLETSVGFPGTGIGLATAQRIVHRHGGTIRAESVRGEWAEFSFTLPH